jgi:hypothetical protein
MEFGIDSLVDLLWSVFLAQWVLILNPLALPTLSCPLLVRARLYE